jgi:hypothetical protein
MNIKINLSLMALLMLIGWCIKLKDQLGFKLRIKK